MISSLCDIYTSLRIAGRKTDLIDYYHAVP